MLAMVFSRVSPRGRIGEHDEMTHWPVSSHADLGTPASPSLTTKLVMCVSRSRGKTFRAAMESGRSMRDSSLRWFLHPRVPGASDGLKQWGHPLLLNTLLWHLHEGVMSLNENMDWSRGRLSAGENLETQAPHHLALQMEALSK
jgi:hypothetical protein